MHHSQNIIFNIKKNQNCKAYLKWRFINAMKYSMNFDKIILYIYIYKAGKYISTNDINK